ncbi:thermonuclease family protein [Spongiibacter sp. UBA1325]|uniref:thermonuclease family protein n=1 Tax=Spongiibacter sp. UBA1325 TaxID=1947543 RepID=UPI00257F9D0A|nr:thermonuclease family protein [Spongiibacter sp. UBA1325]
MSLGWPSVLVSTSQGINRLFIVIFVSLLALGASAKEYGDVVVSEVRTIYDGDTFRANINGWPAVVGESMSIRIKGIDTPELRGKCQSEKEAARLAKQYSVAKLRAANRVELKAIERGKYFRLLADVWVDDENLGEALISAGHAVRYGGGKKKDWCT